MGVMTKFMAMARAMNTTAPTTRLTTAPRMLCIFL